MQNNFGVYIYIQKNLCKCYTKTGLKPGMCPWVFRILQIICCTMSFSGHPPILAGFQCHHIYKYFMHGRASCAGEPCLSAGAGRRGQETIQAPGVLEARLLQIFDHGGRRCRCRPLQGSLMAGHGLIHSLFCIIFFWRMLCCLSLSDAARGLGFFAWGRFFLTFCKHGFFQAKAKSWLILQRLVNLVNAGQIIRSNLFKQASHCSSNQRDRVGVASSLDLQGLAVET